jgi:peptidoglycan/LPS O-acetylase OafA/YrhL
MRTVEARPHSPGLGYVPGLDGLRAVCALLVVSWHVRGDPFVSWRGGTGVYVFFVLSGFLITTIGVAEERRSGRVDLRGFFVRRASRILPVFYLVLAAYVVAVPILGLGDRSERFLDALPYHLTFLSEIPHVRFAGDVPFDVAWSLGIEEKFYVVWALVGFGLLRGRGRPIVASVLLVAALASQLVDGNLSEYVVYYAFVLIGVLLALVRDDPRGQAQLERLATPRAGVVATVIAVVLSRNSDIGGDLWPLLFGVASAAVIAHVVVGDSPVARFLARPTMVWLGTLSYAIYLLHQLTLGIAEAVVPSSTIGNLVTFVVGLALAIAAAALVSRYVEQPAIRWGRRRSGRPAD